MPATLLPYTAAALRKSRSTAGTRKVFFGSMTDVKTVSADNEVMVAGREIDVARLQEHSLLPFHDGQAAVAPDDRR